METIKKEKKEMTKNEKKYLSVVITLLLLSVILIVWLAVTLNEGGRLKKYATEISLRHKTDSAKLAVALGDLAEAKAATAADTIPTPEPCLKNRENGDTIFIKMVSPAKANKIKHTGTKKRSPKTETKQQNLTGDFQSAPDRSVSTSVIEGTARKEIFCINVHDMDGSSFWPQLAIDIGDQVEGATPNNTRDGHNITIYPVREISGLYGVTLDKRVFVRCDLLDRFGPTIIKICGSPNGWRTWVTAEKVGSYYVADL